MSIASRINEIREHLTNTWDDIDSLGIGVKILPNEYTQVDYLESSGTQYIDTGVNADAKLRVETDTSFISPTSDNQTFGAIKTGSSTIRYHILCRKQKIELWVNDYGYVVGDLDSDKHYYDINPSRSYVKFDDTTITIPSNIGDTTLNFWLFGRNSTGPIYMPTMKLWTCKMYYENVLVRDFVPCYRNSDNEVGLYDLVNNVFYTNQGTGAFTYGSENIEYIDKNLENVDVTLKKLYGTISDKTDMSTNGIKGDTNQETITAETGTNVNAKSISISDVDTDKEHTIGIDGNTYQETTTGKNLFDINNYQNAILRGGGNNISITKENDTTLKTINTIASSNNFCGIPIPNSESLLGKTVTASTDVELYNVTDTKFLFYFLSNTSATTAIGTSTSVTSNGNYTVTATIPSEIPSGSTRIGLMLYASTTSQPINSYVLWKNIQIEVGTSSTTPYEPYTYGASPNPDYPQNIDVVTGENNIKIEGKNLFKASSSNYKQGLTITYDSDTGEITFGGTTTGGYPTLSNYTNTYIPAGTYTFSIDKTLPYAISCRFKNASGQYPTSISIDSGELSKTVTTTYDAVSLELVYSATTSGITILETTIKPMIEKGSTTTTYEPYISQTYLINLGKNLFDKDNATMLNNYYINGSGGFTASNGYHSIYLPCEPNTTYTISWMNVTPTNKNRCRIATCNTAITSSSTLTLLFNGTNGQYHSPQTITTPYDAKYLVFDLIEGSGATTTLSDLINSIQVEKGSTATNYAPYFNPIELCKISTYKDRIYPLNDKWYLEKNIGKVALNNNFSRIDYIVEKTNTIRFDFRNLLTNSLMINENKIICDKYISLYGNDTDIEHCRNLSTSYVDTFCFYLNKVRLADISTTEKITESLRNWLSSNNLLVYYVLETPTTTEITDSTLVSQLNALANSTLYTTTNINTETSNLLPYIDLQYNVVTPAPSPERPSEVQNVSGNISYKITGKNKLNPADFNTTEAVNGISALANQYYLQLSGTPTGTNRTIGTNLDITNIVKNLNTVTFSFSTISGEYPYSFRLYVRDATSTIVERIDTVTKTVTYTDGYTYTIAPFILSTATASEINCTLVLQLEEGSTATTFEPYLGKTYPISLTSKNLFDKDNMVLNSYIRPDGSTLSTEYWNISDYISVSPNEQYTYQGLTTIGTDSIQSAYYDENKNFINVFKQAIGNNTITIPNNVYYVRFSINKASNDKDTFMIEKGSTATTYEAYYNIELCKISTYQDRIYSDNGKIYLEKNIGKAILNGSEDWSKSSNTSVDRFIRSSTIPKNTQGISNYFSVVTSLVTNVGTFYFNNNQQVANYSPYGTTTLAQFKEWVTTNKPIVYYALATPTTTEITPTNYPTLYNQLKDIIDYLTQYKINNEFILGYDSPEIEY